MGANYGIFILFFAKLSTSFVIHEHGNTTVKYNEFLAGTENYRNFRTKTEAKKKEFNLSNFWFLNLICSLWLKILLSLITAKRIQF